MSILEYAKACSAEVLEAAEEQQQQQQEQQHQEDLDLEEGQAHEELPVATKATPRIGNATTALKVWIASIKFWNTISAKIEGDAGDYDEEKLKVYATKGQEAGRVWGGQFAHHSQPKEMHPNDSEADAQQQLHGISPSPLTD